MSPMRDYRDVGSGLFLAVIGAGLFAHSMSSYRMGTAFQIGPGVWPAALGVSLVLLGLGIAVTGYLRKGEAIDFDLRALVSVLIALTAFGLTVRSLGLAPAICVLIALCRFADRRLTPRSILLLSAVMSGLIYIIFKLLLGIPMPMFAWRF